MQTSLPKEFLKTKDGVTADSILRACVHCGFCTATCPTYQLLGDELDGPRGRIYQIKNFLESGNVGEHLSTHLDRCLQCRSCETTCPSGVKYTELLAIGKKQLAKTQTTPIKKHLMELFVNHVLPYPTRLQPLISTARLAKPLLPSVIKQQIPTKQTIKTPIETDHPDSVLVLHGCVQSVTHPSINDALTTLLNYCKQNVIIASRQQCCGAIEHHNNHHSGAVAAAKRNIDQWWPHIQNGCQAIVASATGCSLMLHEYPQLLANEANYSHKAQQMIELLREPHELLSKLTIDDFSHNHSVYAYHPPCTQQHGLKDADATQAFLKKMGYNIQLPEQHHLCCGSAGTYSLFQKELSEQLKTNKLHYLSKIPSEKIITANIGCIMQLQSNSKTPVIHWLELLANDLKTG